MKRGKTKDVKRVSRRPREKESASEGEKKREEGKAVTLQWRFQVFPPLEQRIIGA